MELEEWEFLPDTKNLLEFSHESANDKLLSSDLSMYNEVILMDYFICPSQCKDLVSSAAVSSELDAITIKNKDEDGNPSSEDFKDICFAPPVMLAIHDSLAHAQFKKIKEDGFVDMRVNFPRTPSTRELFIMDDVDSIEIRVEKLDSKSLGRKEIIKEEMEDKIKSESFGVCIWRWRFTGIGALCSIGAAAATTLCIFIFAVTSTGQKHQKQNNHKNQFQKSTDDKMVQEITRLKQAFSAAKGASVTRAHITFGGYYEGL